MNARGIAAWALALLALAGCSSAGSSAGKEPFDLPVGPTRWDATAPSWLYDGTLHVGKKSVELGDHVESYVLGATGAYWMRGETLMFTSTEGRTQKVEKVGWDNMAVSADRSVFATVDQSRGPKDEFGTRVIQATVFDTRTGKQIYRTPDEKPDDDDDLADLYEETTPLLAGVSDERLFFDDVTIDLRDSSTEPMSTDVDGMDVYEGWDETLFADGYPVGTEGKGGHREVSESTLRGEGRLSPDRSTLFDLGTMETEEGVFDARTGRERTLHAPWNHFVLVGWDDKDTFFGVAEHREETADGDVLRGRQVVSCELRTLDCTAVSAVLPGDEETAETPRFQVEATSDSSWL